MPCRWLQSRYQIPRRISWQATMGALLLKRAGNHLIRHYSSPSINRPFRIAVIGSGPAGFYASYRVMQKNSGAVVDMYEQLPVPYGLVRYGVAPDHPEVKNCQDKFEEVATSPRFNFIGNIRVGYDLPLHLFKNHYDAILFAYGASEDRKLGIPSEDELDGIYSARAFVGWYNGLPEYRNLRPKLDQGEEAVVIGQGNVALDVARILLSDIDVLRKTDITEYALDALSKNRIKSVKIVGRRGPMQAAFTIKEARELMNLSSVFFEPIPPYLLPADNVKLPRQQKRITQVLSKGSVATAARKSWAFRFFMSPTQFCSSSSGSQKLGAVNFIHTKFAENTEQFSSSAKVVNEDSSSSQLPADLAFRSIGYKSTPLPGLPELCVPFESRAGVISNDGYGRVINANLGPGQLAAGHVPGMYCAGWVKRGPTGVIASTMEDAFATADVIVRDWDQGAKFINPHAQMYMPLGWDGLKAEIAQRGLIPVDWAGWKEIDAVERKRGAAVGKVREKFTNAHDMLKVLGV